MKRYFLEFHGMVKEVTKDEWIKAERAAGFKPKCSCKFLAMPCTHEATSGFSTSHGVGGYILYKGSTNENRKTE